MSDATASVTSSDLPLPPAEQELAPAVAAGRALRAMDRLPDTPHRFLLTLAQRPTKPVKGVVIDAAVSRETVRSADRTVPGVPVTWIDRERASAATIVHLHGGAYVLAEAPGHWEWLEELRRRSGTAAAMVHYRMPPRHPFPQALEDAHTAVTELLDSSVLRDGRWILSGDSAGGGLALALAQRLAAEGEHGPAGLLLMSPWTDLTLSDPSIPQQQERDVVLTAESLARAARLYAGSYRRSDPRLSPRFGDFHGLPPVHLIGAGDDILLGDARAAHASLLDAGVPVEYHEQAGAPHDYPALIQGASSQWAVRRQIGFVRRILPVHVPADQS